MNSIRILKSCFFSLKNLLCTQWFFACFVFFVLFLWMTLCFKPISELFFEWWLLVFAFLELNKTICGGDPLTAFELVTMFFVSPDLKELASCGKAGVGFARSAEAFSTLSSLVSFFDASNVPLLLVLLVEASDLSSLIVLFVVDSLSRVTSSCALSAVAFPLASSSCTAVSFFVCSLPSSEPFIALNVISFFPFDVLLLDPPSVAKALVSFSFISSSVFSFLASLLSFSFLSLLSKMFFLPPPAPPPPPLLPLQQQQQQGWQQQLG